MAFEELKEAGNEAAMKAKGRYRQEGKQYVVEDGDVARPRPAACTARTAVHMMISSRRPRFFPQQLVRGSVQRFL